VHRQHQAKERRNQHPESSLWESEVGSDWLRQMVIATLFHFGLGAGCGGDSLSQFFKMIRIDTHIGVSPSVLRKLLNKMELLLPQFQKECESQLDDKSRKIVAGLDETFFSGFMILVLMDLRSGYLLLEEVSEDRCFDTWYAKTTPRLKALGIDVNHAISDRAKALIKMAFDGFECESGADLFHAQQDVSRWLGSTISRRVTKAEKNLESAKKAEENAPISTTGLEIIGLKMDNIKAEKTFNNAKKSSADYHENLQGVSEDLHPFSLEDNGIHNASQIEIKLEKRAQAFENIAKEQEINDNKDTMKKFRKQFQPLSVSVSFWWSWILESLQELVVDDDKMQQWLTATLLPVSYWHQQMCKTKNRKLKEKYRLAWERSVQEFKAHPLSKALSDSEIQRWLTWAETMARQFQRSSSAVEGRNGCLSQMYHNGRGLSKQRLGALTVIHNYWLKRADDTTAATRLFDREFPDLFSWLLDEMNALPLPRKSRGRSIAKSLILESVPS
jgi:hypothetical protein